MSSSIGTKSALTAIALTTLSMIGFTGTAHAATLSDGDRAVNYIEKHDLGKRYSEYRNHGMGPNYFDCSGLLKSGFSKGAKRWLPRIAQDQYNYLRNKKHTFSSKSKLRRGDLIFFHSRNGYVFHVGVFTGKGNMINANSTRGRVKFDKAFLNWGFAYENYGRI